MKSYSSREVIKILRKDGWYEIMCVAVKHPDKDIPRDTLDSIERQSGLRFR